MRLAAILILSHEYLIDEPQTINLGGRFIYSFNIEGSTINISKKINEDFIEDFFDQTKLESKLLSVNAIVGQNGTGKSSIFDSIRSTFVENPYTLPENSTILFFETDDYKELKYASSIFEKSEGVIKFKTEQPDIIIQKQRSNSDVQSIYYSPHFDFKYNPNFEIIDNYDISFDKILEEDLEDLENKKPNQSGWNYSPSQELLFKNAIRQILFLSSEIVTKDKIFQNLFDFPEFGEARLVIRGYKEEREWNTPSSFRSGIEIVKGKLKKELDDWHKIRMFKSSGRVSNQIEVNKYILKRNILSDIISVLERQMEKQNSYLSQGKFEYKTFKKDSLGEDAFNTFLVFINKCYLKFGTESIQAFDETVIRKLLEKLYETIDNLDDLKKITTDHFITNGSDAIEILTLQRKFLNNLFNYYFLFQENSEQKTLKNSDRIDGFINYMPSKKKLSSGENALLNLFSRLYDFLNFKLKKDSRFLKESNNYLLLLDEADLGFHPVWKKKFVQSIVSTITYFFNSLENKPNVQIIFSTHDPLTLSDLPNKNIIYLLKNIDTEKTEILDYTNTIRPNKSFAANITDLLSDSFFIENGLIGDFVKNQINEVIKWLNNDNKIIKGSHEEIIARRIKKIIEIIDEPILKIKLLEMYGEKLGTSVRNEILDQQIKYLESLRDD